MPSCSLACFPQAKRCECGYTFTTCAMPPSSLVHRDIDLTGGPNAGGFIPPGDGGSTGGEGGANRQMVVGVVLILLGVAITLGTYNAAAASGGGRYVIAHGPIIFGVITFLLGVGGSLKR